MERACNGKMQQRRQIIQGDSHLFYQQMETTSFLMPPLHESRHKSLITSVQ